MTQTSNFKVQTLVESHVESSLTPQILVDENVDKNICDFHQYGNVRSRILSTKEKVLPRFELGLLDSKSKVIAITP